MGPLGSFKIPKNNNFSYSRINFLPSHLKNWKHLPLFSQLSGVIKVDFFLIRGVLCPLYIVWKRCRIQDRRPLCPMSLSRHQSIPLCCVKWAGSLSGGTHFVSGTSTGFVKRNISSACLGRTSSPILYSLPQHVHSAESMLFDPENQPGIQGTLSFWGP